VQRRLCSLPGGALRDRRLIAVNPWGCLFGTLMNVERPTLKGALELVAVSASVAAAQGRLLRERLIPRAQL